MSAKSTQDRTEEGFAEDLFDKQKAYLAPGENRVGVLAAVLTCNSSRAKFTV